MINVNRIAVAFRKENRDEFVLFLLEPKKTVICKDFKIWDMFEVSNSKYRYEITGEDNKKGCLIISDDVVDSLPLALLLKIRLDNARDPETNICHVRWKDLWSTEA